MIRELSALGVEITRFQEDDPSPSNCDVLWDPGMCMRRIPTILRTSAVPVVGTMHGVKAFSLSLEELTRSSDEHYALEQLKESVKEDWQWFRERARAITAVSEYAAKEIIQAFDLPASMVHVVRNGVDHSIFCPTGKSAKSNRPYFMHVSRLDPVKNVDRILASYARLPEVDRPSLVAVVTPEKLMTSIGYGRKFHSMNSHACIEVLWPWFIHLCERRLGCQSSKLWLLVVQ
jgi:glycosyltransferase involved in cell wall biosynthesis